MSFMDIVSLSIGLASFALFLLIQLIVFRWVKPEQLLKALTSCAAAIIIFPPMLMSFLRLGHVVTAPGIQWLMGALLAIGISGLLAFTYVVCIFGPYETSVRMRLIREIAQANQGLTQEEIWQRYNPTVMARLRLQRLVGAGDLMEVQGRYHLNRKGHFLVVFDVIGNSLKKWIKQ